MLIVEDNPDHWIIIQQVIEIAFPNVQVSWASNLQEDAADIYESYDRGVTTYLIKPTDFDSWTQTFQVLKKYWLDTVLLPPTRIYH